MATIISPKMCFICGTYGDEHNGIERHHIIPRSMLTGIHNNTLDVCHKCHCGIHNRYYGLKPNSKSYYKIKTLIKRYAKNHDKLLQKAMEVTIIKESESILSYHSFLDYQDHYTEK